LSQKACSPEPTVQMRTRGTCRSRIARKADRPATPKYVAMSADGV
jgi:hypothetical protein